jgi:hypothetical protein
VKSTKKKKQTNFSYLIAIKHAFEKDRALLAQKFKYVVTINHPDLTTCVFHNAFVEEFSCWLIVYTEHNGFHIFLNRELQWRVLKRK